MISQERGELLVQVASLYYHEHLTQAEIASRVNLSRQTVSRLLRDAEESGVVQIEIRSPNAIIAELSEQLKARFHLRAATVIDTGDTDEERAQQAVTRAAALACRDRMGACRAIALPWGQAILQFARNLPRGSFPHLTIAQMDGMIPSASGSMASELAVRAAAENLGAQPKLFAAPLYVDSQLVRDVLLSDSRVAETLQTARQAEMALYSVGPATARNALCQSGYLSAEEMQQLRAEGAVGEFSGLFFTRSGKACGEALVARTVALPLEAVLRIPTRILIASGLYKTEAVLGALSGGYATETYLDRALATAVLDAPDEIRG